MDRWFCFLVTEFEQPLWRIARHTFIYPEDKRLPKDAALARQECLAMVAVLARHMAGREFMAGDRLSVADFTAAHTLAWANEAEMLDVAPPLREYLAQMYARPTAPQMISDAFAAHPCPTRRLRRLLTLTLRSFPSRPFA